METSHIIEQLEKWNFWNQDIDTGTARTQYLDDIKPLLDIPEVIALVGLRRTGKSTICYQLLQHLLSQGVPKENTLFINLEDPAWGDSLNLRTLQEIYQAYLEVKAPQGRIYLFLDEVQRVPQWERFVLSLYDSKQQVKSIVTGSNSQLLQDTFSKLLSGRYIAKQVFPLSFSEYLEFRKADREEPSAYLLHHLRYYLQYGGLPRVVLENNLQVKNYILQDYYNSIVENDIILQHGVRNKTEIKNLLLYLMSHIGTRISTYNLEKVIGVSAQSIREYLDHIEQAFLISRVKQYHPNVKKQIYNPDKVYVSDTGLAHIGGFQFSPNIGRYMENAVFQHLSHSHRDIYYLQNGKEIDFLIRKGFNPAELIQATYRLHPENWERETAGFLSAQDGYTDIPKTVVYWEDDYPEKPQSDIELVRVDRFFLRADSFSPQKGTVKD